MLQYRAIRHTEAPKLDPHRMWRIPVLEPRGWDPSSVVPTWRILGIDILASAAILSDRNQSAP